MRPERQRLINAMTVISPAAIVTAQEKRADKRKEILVFICAFNHRNNGQYRERKGGNSAHG